MPEGGGQAPCAAPARRGGAAGDAQPAPANGGASPPSGTVISGWRLNASRPPSGASVVAPEQWPTNCASAGVRAAAAAAISASGTHEQHDVGAAGRAPRPSGPSTPRPASRERGGQGVAEPAGADDGAAQGRGDSEGFRSSSRTRYRLGGERCCGLRGPSRGGDGLAPHVTPQRAGSMRLPAAARSYPRAHAQRGRTPRGAQGRLPAGVGLHALPAARLDPPDRRLRLGPRGRRPDVRRRGAGRQRGQAGRPVRRPGGQAARPAARRDRADARRTSSWSTSSSAGLPATATRCRRRSTTARTTCSASSSLIQPRVVCTLGNFATKLLRADPSTGITRLHGREEVRVDRPARRAAVPDLPPGRGALHALAARHAARRLRAPARAARARPAAAARAGEPEPVVPEPELVEEIEASEADLSSDCSDSVPSLRRRAGERRQVREACPDGAGISSARKAAARAPAEDNAAGSEGVSSAAAGWGGSWGKKCRVDRVVLEVAARQHGMVTAAQLDRRRRFGRHAIAHRVAKWLAEAPAPTASTSSDRCETAFSRRHGRGARVRSTAPYSAITPAAVLWGLRRRRQFDEMHITVVGRAVQEPGWRTRAPRTARLHPADATHRHGIPVTSPARTLLDVAATEPARASSTEPPTRPASSASSRTLSSMSSSPATRPPRSRGAATAKRPEPTLTRSEAERRLLELDPRGPPARAADQRAPSARTKSTSSGASHRLVVEVDGYAFHSTRRSFERDRRRDADLTSRGYRVVRLTWRQITDGAGGRSPLARAVAASRARRP